MKNLRNIFKRNFLNVNKYNFKHFCQNAKQKTAKIDDEINNDENKANEKLNEDIKNNTTNNTNGKQQEQNETSFAKKNFNKFKNLWKFTFNIDQSIENTMSKRKAEAAEKKANIVELSEEAAIEVIIK
jgi:uncharacterized protein (DUF2252 family)